MKSIFDPYQYPDYSKMDLRDFQGGAWSKGDQPCDNFHPLILKPTSAPQTRTGSCVDCGKATQRCVNCDKDHHAGGFETCTIDSDGLGRND